MASKSKKNNDGCGWLLLILGAALLLFFLAFWAWIFVLSIEDSLREGERAYWIWLAVMSAIGAVAYVALKRLRTRMIVALTIIVHVMFWSLTAYLLWAVIATIHDSQYSNTKLLSDELWGDTWDGTLLSSTRDLAYYIVMRDIYLTDLILPLLIAASYVTALLVLRDEKNRQHVRAAMDVLTRRLRAGECFPVTLVGKSDSGWLARIDGVREIEAIVPYEEFIPVQAIAALNTRTDETENELHAGDQVRVSIVELQRSGLVVLSERNAATRGMALWEHGGDVLAARIIERFGNKGVSVDIEGLEFYIALGQLVPQWHHQLDDVIEGARPEKTHLKVRVVAYDRLDDQPRLSERAALDALLRDGRAVGEVFYGQVTYVTDRRAFVDFGVTSGRRRRGSDGVVPKSEMAWGHGDSIDPQELLAIGQTVRVMVLRAHRRIAEQVALSIRRAGWAASYSDFQPGQVVPGAVIEVRRDVALLRLPGGIMGRAHRREIVGHRRAGDRPAYLADVIAEGDVVPVKIMSIREDLLHFEVSYREARAEASADHSWVFDQRGRVTGIPDSARTEFPEASEAIEGRYAERRREAETPPA